MKPDELIMQLAALVTIAAAVIWVLDQLMDSRDCCASCAAAKSAPKKKGFGGGEKGPAAAPPRKSACN